MIIVQCIPVRHIQNIQWLRIFVFLDEPLLCYVFKEPTISLQSRCNFGLQVLSMLSSLILVAVEVWGEKEICIKGVING